MNLGQLYIWQDESIAYRFAEQDFDLQHWSGRNDFHPLAGGRGGSGRIRIDGQDFVLRRYLRGGLMARLLNDRYLWSGLEGSRPCQEAGYIQRALDSELPVPAVAAYLVRRSGLFYRAAIISRFVDNQGTLASFLYSQPLADTSWQTLGGVIRKLHDAGIFHSDLNANNILLRDDMTFCLIDFDKARSITSDADRQNNLDRLHRSLSKIQLQRQNDGQALHFCNDDWSNLLVGYGDSPR